MNSHTPPALLAFAAIGLAVFVTVSLLVAEVLRGLPA